MASFLTRGNSREVVGEGDCEGKEPTAKSRWIDMGTAPGATYEKFNKDINNVLSQMDLQIARPRRP